MISFAQDFSKYNQQAIKAAALSTIPGLGQLFNRRLDKAIAFFLVDIANATLLAVLLGAKIPFVNMESATLSAQLYAWRAGTAPFIVVQLMMLSYIFYSQFDAYRDAVTAESVPLKPSEPTFKKFGAHFVLTLSLTTCASYVLHMSAMFALGLLILFKVCPEITPDETPQITMTFELESPRENDHAAENRGQEGQESNERADAHSPERPKDDMINASTKSAQMNAATQQDRPDMKFAANETTAVASKQVDTPEKQLAQETASQGSVEAASKITKTANEQTKVQQSAKANPSKADPTSTEMISAPPKADPFENLTNPKIAQVPIGSTVPSISASENSSQATQITMASVTGPMMPAPFGRAADQTSLTPGDAPQGTQLDKPVEGPSMLGFMDSTLSEDVDMRALWAEMSGNISRFVKENPLKGQGLAMTSFTLDRNGNPVSMQSAPQNSELAQSLNTTLMNMPKILPPKNRENSTFFQVKASNDGKATFISLEVNSQPAVTSEESLSDFKYQTDLQVYLKGIKKAVYSSWKPPVQEGLKPVMVGFKVTTNGRICNQHVVQSSGDPKMDRAALNAALTVTKWAQPPAGTSEDMDVCMVLQRCKNCEGEARQKAMIQGSN